MKFDTFDVVFFTVGFLVPGFIWSAVLSMLVPRRTVSTEVRFLEFLTLSCINHGVWSWALFLIFRTGFIEENPGWSSVFLAGIIAASPVALGLGSAWLSQNDVVGRFLSRLGFRTTEGDYD